jgi:UDP-N-acetylglucosamine diphosphorylase/glucosamine-1-phosphate N-acetyltransferase
MRVALFEDRDCLDAGPIAQLRPVFELVCGHFALRERVVRGRQAAQWGVFVRDWLTETYREQHPESRINDARWLAEGPTLLINGRWLASFDALQNIDARTAGVIDGTVVYVTVEPGEAALFDGGNWEQAIYQVARTRRRVAAAGMLFSYPWHLVDQNAAHIKADFDARTAKGWFPSHEQVALIGAPGNVSVDRTAQIDPFVVLDSTHGPISIDAGAVIQSFTRLEGPCHVGAGAQLFRANIRGGTTIGPGCRVGGEVEASILHAHVNKYHDGFLGHSYVAPWVNLGALSTNSDLKNDYSVVRVPLAGKSIDTRLVKAGCFIGDHTKTGLGSLFNTGSSIGVMCMILPGGELLPKHVPSFTAVWHGALADAMPFERSLAAARVAMQRRGHELTAAQERLLRLVYESTQAERDEAIVRFQERRDRAASAS